MAPGIKICNMYCGGMLSRARTAIPRISIEVSRAATTLGIEKVSRRCAQEHQELQSLEETSGID